MKRAKKKIRQRKTAKRTLIECMSRQILQDFQAFADRWLDLYTEEVKRFAKEREEA